MKNGVMMQYFEWNLPNDGNLWNNLREQASHLHDAGITAVWIPPAYKADEQKDEGYATYDLFDLGEFDQKNTVRTKYGTKYELTEAIKELHKFHISVYLDAVMNHKTGGDHIEKFTVVEADPKQREKNLTDPYEIEASTGFDFKGRGGMYSEFQWHWYHFTGTDYNEINGKKAVYRIMGENKYWSEDVDNENGNYDYLLGNDLDLHHPEVIGELNHWGVWVSNELNLDGMRLDAVKHMDYRFIEQFLQTVRKNRNKEFYAVGEYWKGDFDSLNEYLKNTSFLLDLFDVPLHYKMYQASNQGRKFDLTGFYEDTLVSRYPTNAVTFVDNHDSQRGSSLESQVQSWFKPMAYGMILLTENGYPCIFYGDYYGVKGNPSPHRTILDILLDCRKQYAYGEQKLYFDHPSVAGFTRLGVAEHENSGLAFLISLGDDGNKRMFVGENHKGEIWHEITGNLDKEIMIEEDGSAVFDVEGGKMAVWVKK